MSLGPTTSERAINRAHDDPTMALNTSQRQPGLLAVYLSEFLTERLQFLSSV